MQQHNKTPHLPGETCHKWTLFANPAEDGSLLYYFPNPSKSWQVCSAEEEEAAGAAFDAEGFLIKFTGSQRYIGSFTGSAEALWKCLDPMIQDWVNRVQQLAAMATCLLQTAHTELIVSLKAEWQYVCCIIPGITSVMVQIEDNIQSDFIPALFGGTNPVTEDNTFHCLFSHSVKQGGIGICNPTAVADCLFLASKLATEVLAANLVHGREFSVKAHSAQVKQATCLCAKIGQRWRMHSLKSFLQLTKGFETTFRWQGIGFITHGIHVMPQWNQAVAVGIPWFTNLQTTPQLWGYLQWMQPMLLCWACHVLQKIRIGHMLAWGVKQEWIALAELVFGKSCVVTNPKFSSVMTPGLLQLQQLWQSPLFTMPEILDLDHMEMPLSMDSGWSTLHASLTSA